MANNWFRMYSEFATDAKVQSMPEAMQRRLVMLFCLRCSDVTVTLCDEELAFALRVTEAELAETKALFLRKGFIDESWEITNWDKRQYSSDSSAARTAAYRERKKQAKNNGVTSQERHGDGLDTDTDSDTENNTTANAVVSSEPSSSKPAGDDSPVFISIPTNKFLTSGEERPITEKQIHDFQIAYPAVDVRRVLAQIRSWAINNPSKRKTASGVNRFVDSWLAREQNSFGGSRNVSKLPVQNSARDIPMAEQLESRDWAKP